MNRSQVMHTNQPTAEQAIAQWAHCYHQIVPDPGQICGDQTFVETGEGLGRRYQTEITYHIVVVRYRYAPRGRWHTGYIGYAPTEKRVL